MRELAALGGPEVESMNGPLTPTVQRVTQDTTVSPAGQVQYLMRVQFMVGDHGPFALTIPADQFTADKARALMQATADQLNQLMPAAQG